MAELFCVCLFFAFQAWLELMDQAVEGTDVSQIMCNCEAQHRYLTWRAEKVVLCNASQSMSVLKFEKASHNTLYLASDSNDIFEKLS